MSFKHLIIYILFHIYNVSLRIGKIPSNRFGETLFALFNPFSLNVGFQSVWIRSGGEVLGKSFSEFLKLIFKFWNSFFHCFILLRLLIFVKSKFSCVNSLLVWRGWRTHWFTHPFILEGITNFLFFRYSHVLNFTMLIFSLILRKLFPCLCKVRLNQIHSRKKVTLQFVEIENS